MKSPDSINLEDRDPFVFIVGSPRSGTTILGEILDRHPDISQWYEPYFVWDRFFRSRPDDERTDQDVTLKVKRQIRNNFLRYKYKKGSPIIVDKSPRNSLKILFILKIFPEARFIHIIRDGRDATLSIHREWINRRNIFDSPGQGRGFDYQKARKTIKRWLDRQPFLSDKIKAFWFETHGQLNRKKHLNHLRWRGQVGWGPRFKDWDSYYGHNTLLRFNAFQWLKCVESIEQNWPGIREDRKMTIYYENIIKNPRQEITRILEFLGRNKSDAYFRSLPPLKKNNFNKWKKEFTKTQLDEIQPLLKPMLTALGYI